MIRKFKLKEILDKRGFFLKVFEKIKFKNFNIKDVYISTSKKNVFRGMHYQTDKYAQNKIIICLKGEIIDFAYNLKTKKLSKNKLSDKLNYGLFIPKNYAHGFLSLKNNTQIISICSEVFNSRKEKVIKLKSIDNSFNKKKLILSKKDS
jgi:dTDP-4-dehydrorhamnose 3,5-epimerase|tara:strand:+ start:1584 stop:2030 length:447 start_codon:yes stop_codon:yes gene_type:complete